MLRNTADCAADVDRFIRRVSETDQVWYLTSENGPAVSSSNFGEDGSEPQTVILFFSDRAYAKRAMLKSFPEFKVASMQLFSFMFRWLPGMSRDGKLAGPNWTGDLIGLEIDPHELRERVEKSMTADLRAAHAREYERLVALESRA